MESKAEKNPKKQPGLWRENLHGHILKRKVESRWGKKKNQKKTPNKLKTTSQIREPNQEYLRYTEGEGKKQKPQELNTKAKVQEWKKRQEAEYLSG